MIDIAYTKLKDLYINKNLSRDEVAKLLNISVTTVKRFISKYNLHKSQEQIQKQREKTYIKLFGTDCLLSDSKFRNMIKETNIKKYGVANPAKSTIVKDKISKTLLSKDEIFFEKRELKRKETCLKKYNVDNIMKDEKLRNKLYINLALKAGFTENLLEEGKKIKLQKEIITKRKNNSFNASKPEDKIYKILCTKFKEVIRQYKSEKYPFNCDFYIKDTDCFIEFQGHWTHGGHAFNINNQDDLNKLKYWENKNNTFYNTAIKVWTIMDIKKRNLAKQNNLNWLEFFTLDEFKIWFNSI